MSLALTAFTLFHQNFFSTLPWGLVTQQGAAISTPVPLDEMLVNCGVIPEHRPPPPNSSFKSAGPCLNTRGERHCEVRCLTQEYNTMNQAKGLGPRPIHPDFITYLPQLFKLECPEGKYFAPIHFVLKMTAYNHLIFPYSIPTWSIILQLRHNKNNATSEAVHKNKFKKIYRA